MSELYLRNRQRTRPVHLPTFRALAADLVERLCGPAAEIGILLVADAEMTRLNEAYLRHRGSTDVLAFGYASQDGRCVQGELFLCVDEALRQAARFHTSWEQELVRYLVHGLLHLQGYEDSTSLKRREMKRVEDSTLKEVCRQFCLSRLSARAKVRA